MSQHDNKQKLFGNFSWFPAFSQEHLPPHKCGMEKASNYGSFSRFHRTSTHLKIAWTIWTCLTSSTLHRRISYICLTLKAELKTPPGSPTPSVGFQFIRFFFFLLQAVRSQAHYSQQTKATTSWSQTYIYICSPKTFFGSRWHSGFLINFEIRALRFRVIWPDSSLVLTPRSSF